jgi:hypothetical protein
MQGSHEKPKRAPEEKTSTLRKSVGPRETKGTEKHLCVTVASNEKREQKTCKTYLRVSEGDKVFEKWRTRRSVVRKRQPNNVMGGSANDQGQE